jgi:proline dehydrogenase
LGTNIVKIAFKVKAPIKGIIRNTIFEHFCGGESIQDCEKTIRMLAQYNVKTILDYAVEGDSGEADLDNTADEIIRTIDRARNDPNIPFSVFKPSGIAPKNLLAKIQAGQHLSPEEEETYSSVKARFDRIADHASGSHVRLYIDSEDSWYQDPIDEIVNDLMMRYNRQKVVVFNTYQMYRKGMLDNLKMIVERGKKEGFYVGAKLVRGAYMEKERERAEQQGYADPIMPDKQATDDQYDEALLFCLQHINMMELCSGSHNENSNYRLVDLMAKYKLEDHDDRIYFAQLFGMSDHISFNLAHAGYNVVKYVPYGPVEAVMPYLFRRAEENTSIAGQSSRELKLIREERRRRRKANQ